MNPQIESPQLAVTNGGLGSLGTTGNNYSSDVKCYPPYAREYLKELKRGRWPNTFIFCGNDSWQRADKRRITHGPGSGLVLPSKSNPSDFKWPRFESVIVQPDNCSGDRIRELIRELLIAGARCVVEFRPWQAPICHYSSPGGIREAA